MDIIPTETHRTQHYWTKYLESESATQAKRKISPPQNTNTPRTTHVRVPQPRLRAHRYDSRRSGDVEGGEDGFGEYLLVR